VTFSRCVCSINQKITRKDQFAEMYKLSVFRRQVVLDKFLCIYFILKIEYYTGLVLLTYVTLTKKLLKLEYKWTGNEDELDELTSGLSQLPKFDELLKRAYDGKLPKSNMIEEGKEDDKKHTSQNVTDVSKLATAKKFASNVVGGAISGLSSTVRHVFGKARNWVPSFVLKRPAPHVKSKVLMPTKNEPAEGTVIKEKKNEPVKKYDTTEKKKEPVGKNGTTETNIGKARNLVPSFAVKQPAPHKVLLLMPKINDDEPAAAEEIVINEKKDEPVKNGDTTEIKRAESSFEKCKWCHLSKRCKWGVIFRKSANGVIFRKSANGVIFRKRANGVIFRKSANGVIFRKRANGVIFRKSANAHRKMPQKEQNATSLRGIFL
jgi:hypothetical protein